MTETLVILVCNVQRYPIRFLVALALLVLLEMEKLAKVADAFEVMTSVVTTTRDYKKYFTITAISIDGPSM